MESQSGTKNWLSTAWVAVVLLIPVAILNYMDRQMLAAMRFSVTADVHGINNDADWGLILACFKWTYAFLSPLGGYIADRFGRKRVIIASLCVWSAITWLTGQVESYDQLLWTRALMGISEAFYIPAALALITDFHVANTRVRAVGFHQMGIYAGVILGGFTGYLADAPSYGWRWVFSTAGLIGLIYAIPLIIWLREPLRFQNELQAKKDSLPESLRRLLSNPSFLLMLIYFTLPALSGWIVRDWMPSILKEYFAISQGRSAVTATLAAQLSAIVGAVGGGWLADKWMQRNQRGRIYLSAIGVGLLVPALLGMGVSPSVGSLTIAIVSLILFGIGWGFFDSNNMPILCQIANPEHRATGYGLMNMVSLSCGGLANLSFGLMKKNDFSLLTIFALFSLFAVVSIPVVLAVKPRKTEEL